jgi:hypothetical protein
MHTKKAKEFDARADKIDATIAQGRKNGMAQEAITALNKRRGY